MNKWFKAITLSCSFLIMQNSNADGAQCQGHFVNPITDICWDCLFPVTLGDVGVVPSSYPDTSNPGNPICICPMTVGYQIGVSFGFWEPYALADVTREPFCMVNLGMKLDVGMLGQDIGGQQNGQGTVAYGGFYWAHWYKYPLTYWLQILTQVACMDTGDFDIAYLTELDPTWNDDNLAFALNPESVLFGNPIAQASCAFDAGSASTGMSTATDSLFWCMGSQGSSYPLTGNYTEHVTNIQAATLVSEKLNFKLHREGLTWDSVGEDAPALCYQYPTPILPKSRYRYQMVNTVPKADSCYPYGTMTAFWESGHDDLSNGQNYGFLMWRKRNCCFF